MTAVEFQHAEAQSVLDNLDPVKRWQREQMIKAEALDQVVTELTEMMTDENSIEQMLDMDVTQLMDGLTNRAREFRKEGGDNELGKLLRS